jgi:hypothetical protein
VSAAQSAFVNKMINVLPATAPGVDPAAVIATGATQIHSAFAADQLPGIVLAYMAGIKVAFALSIGATGVAFLAGLFCSWNRLHASSPAAEDDVELKGGVSESSLA